MAKSKNTTDKVVTEKMKVTIDKGKASEQVLEVKVKVPNLNFPWDESTNEGLLAIAQTARDCVAQNDWKNKGPSIAKLVWKSVRAIINYEVGSPLRVDPVAEVQGNIKASLKILKDAEKDPKGNAQLIKILKEEIAKYRKRLSELGGTENGCSMVKLLPWIIFGTLAACLFGVFCF